MLFPQRNESDDVLKDNVFFNTRENRQNRETFWVICLKKKYKTF